VASKRFSVGMNTPAVRLLRIRYGPAYAVHIIDRDFSQSIARRKNIRQSPAKFLRSIAPPTRLRSASCFRETSSNCFLDGSTSSAVTFFSGKPIRRGEQPYFAHRVVSLSGVAAGADFEASPGSWVASARAETDAWPASSSNLSATFAFAVLEQYACPIRPSVAWPSTTERLRWRGNP